MAVRRAAAGPRLRKPMRISPNVALRAESRVRENPFQLSKQLTALHPPGVGMALDDGAYTSLSGFSNWSYNNFASMAAEGQIFLGYPTLAAMGQRNENAVAVTTIADDMTRKWIRLKGQAGLEKQVADIVRGYSIFVLKTNMQSVLAGAEDSDLIRRIAIFNKLRNKGGNEGAFLIDKDTEDFGNISANLSGIDALQAAAQEHMAAAWR